MNKKDFIFFVGSEWTNHSQRGQSMAIELASRGHRVFYMQPMFSLGRFYLSLRGNRLIMNQTIEGVHVLTPMLCFLTFRGSFLYRLEKKIFAFWFRQIKKRYEIADSAVIICNMPYWEKFINQEQTFLKHQLVYDCIDDCKVYSRNASIERETVEAEITIAKRARLCLATAESLYNKMLALNPNTVLLSNGVNDKHFIRKSYQIVEESKNTKGSIIGFIGALFYWIDFRAFEVLAEAFPDSTIVLIGPTDRKEELQTLVGRYSNIQYWGSKPYSEIPNYINLFDICLNPFKVDQLGNAVNPLKLYEYLIMGKAVVSSSTEEMRKFEQYIYLYEKEAELIDQVKLALTERSDEKRKERIHFASLNSWRGKIDSLLDLLEK